MDDGHYIYQVDISSEIPSFSKNTTGKTFVEIIRIIILSRLSRERDEAPIRVEALGPGLVGPCLKTSLHVENSWFSLQENTSRIKGQVQSRLMSELNDPLLILILLSLLYASDPRTGTGPWIKWCRAT
ncbi:hypothetical protein TNCV_2820421 [Trichonephila clavipes]|nr:hypothetical protein TNCV_2820421 [Trichonephila clavipes]